MNFFEQKGPILSLAPSAQYGQFSKQYRWVASSGHVLCAFCCYDLILFAVMEHFLVSKSGLPDGELQEHLRAVALEASATIFPLTV